MRCLEVKSQARQHCNSLVCNLCVLCHGPIWSGQGLAARRSQSSISQVLLL